MNEKSLKVLEQYEIEIISTRRGRGSYICETDQGKKLLANCGSSEKKMVFVNRVLTSMRENGYPYADRVLPNREGRLLTPDYEGEPCVLKDWYEGRECDTKNMTDVEQAAGKLGQLHNILYLAPQEADSRYAGEDLRQELERRSRELRKIYGFVRKRKQKNEFEILFLNCFSMFYEQAQEAEKRLAQSDYGSLRAQVLEKGALCHGNFNQHNVWFVSRNQMFVGNFDKCRYDVQAADLYQFLRKIMEKQEWNCGGAYRILERYDKERTLDAREKEYLYIRLLYPEKFWKLANQYYTRNKAWIPVKNTEKLQTLIGQQELRNSFLKTLE